MIELLFFLTGGVVGMLVGVGAMALVAIGCDIEAVEEERR